MAATFYVHVPEIVAALKTAVPGLDGMGTDARSWEGETPNSIRILIRSRTGLPGLGLYWSYSDAAGEQHQKASVALTPLKLAKAVQDIVADELKAVSRHFKDSSVDAAIAAQALLPLSELLAEGQEAGTGTMTIGGFELQSTEYESEGTLAIDAFDPNSVGADGIEHPPDENQEPGEHDAAVGWYPDTPDDPTGFEDDDGEAQEG